MRLTPPSIPSLSLGLTLLLAILASPLLAQRGGGGGGSKGGSMSSTSPSMTADPPNVNEFAVYNIPTTFTGEQPGTALGPPPCFRWPISGTISATATSKQLLEVPSTAYSEFQDGCSDAEARKLEKAEKHLRAAVKEFPRYAAAWVLLGQVQRDEKNEEEAAKSCQRASEIDAKFLSPYLCLADLSARAGKWDQVSILTGQVLDLHPIKAPGAYYYNSLANFHLQQLAVAEKSGLQAVAEGRPEQKLQVRLLLAKIYEAKGDRDSEAVQLREYLKLQPPASDAAVASKVLQQIESQQAGSSSGSPDKK